MVPICRVPISRRRSVLHILLTVQAECQAQDCCLFTTLFLASMLNSTVPHLTPSESINYQTTMFFVLLFCMPNLRYFQDEEAYELKNFGYKFEMVQEDLDLSEVAVCSQRGH